MSSYNNLNRCAFLKQKIPVSSRHGSIRRPVLKELINQNNEISRNFESRRLVATNTSFDSTCQVANTFNYNWVWDKGTNYESMWDTENRNPDANKASTWQEINATFESTSDNESESYNETVNSDDGKIDALEINNSEDKWSIDTNDEAMAQTLDVIYEAPQEIMDCVARFDRADPDSGLMPERINFDEETTLDANDSSTQINADQAIIEIPSVEASSEAVNSYIEEIFDFLNSDIERLDTINQHQDNEMILETAVVETLISSSDEDQQQLKETIINSDDEAIRFDRVNSNNGLMFERMNLSAETTINSTNPSNSEIILDTDNGNEPRLEISISASVETSFEAVMGEIYDLIYSSGERLDTSSPPEKEITPKTVNPAAVEILSSNKESNSSNRNEEDVEEIAIQFNNAVDLEETNNGCASSNPPIISTRDNKDLTEDPEIVINYLKCREEKYTVNFYLNQYPHLNKQCRALIIDWMVQLHTKLNFYQETLHVAVKLFDLYLMKINANDLKLIGLAAIYTAAKLEKISSPAIRYLTDISGLKFDKEDFRKIEAQMILACNGQFAIPTAYLFLHQFALIGKADKNTYFLALFILEYSLMNYFVVDLSGSELAAASLYLAMKSTRTDNWKSEMRVKTGYCAMYIHNKALDLHSFLMTENKKLMTIRKKYSTVEYQQASLMPIMSAIELIG